MISNKNLIKNIFISTILVFLIISFQNCSKGFEVGESELSPQQKLTLACFDSAEFDSCIYQKSAVQQAGTAVTTDNAYQYQSFGINLSEQLNTNSLESSSFKIFSNAGKATKNSNSWKFSYYDRANEFSQVFAYYYLTEFKNYFKKSAGIFYAENRSIKVITDSSFSSWSGQLNEINLETQENKIPSALDAGILVNLLAHANAYYASGGQSANNQTTAAKGCGNKKGAFTPLACCKTSNGCGPALLAGQADYMTAVFFEKISTQIGESWSSDPNGISICEISRDVSKNTNLTTAQAYSACSIYSSPGNIYNMGSLYASIWWESRKKITDKNNFDLFFMKHLEQIRGDDTFLSIKAKLQTLDSSQFSNKYYSVLSAEFQKRGL